MMPNHVRSVLEGLDAVTDALGTELGVSPWLTVDQNRINHFADATEDHQWIHVDPVRAAEGPYATTIAHGFLVLSLLPKLYNQVVEFRGFNARINYGLNRVRFPSPVPHGARIRDRVHLAEVTTIPNGLQVLLDHAVEIEGSAKPGCVAQTVLRLLT